VRRVFAKEWLQGQMIAMFGLLMGGLVTALWGILTVAYVRNWTDQETVNGFCGVMYYLVPLVLAAFVGSGLFAAEVERGTMPLLLALPFSRRQVWVGKALAGLALMLCAVVLVLVPAVIAVRPALEEVEFWKLLPEIALATVLLYSAALFWSTVLPTIMGALLGAVALVAALVVTAIAMMVFGGRLFGPPVLDIELWALAAAPGLLAGSYVGFARGETFRGRRRWVLPLAVAAALYLVVGIAYVGLARWGTRYERALVHRVDAPHVTGGGKVVGMITHGSPVQLKREIETKLTGGEGGDRRVYSICLDLDTRKELLVRRDTGVPKVSPDGKHAVLLTQPRPLTWRGEAWDYGAGPIIEIWDLARQRLTYRGVPRLPRDAGYAVLIRSTEWSPDSRWVVLTTQRGPDGECRVLLLRPDGRVELKTEESVGYRGGVGRVEYAYAPSGAAFYVLDTRGVLTRYEPDGKRTATIWSISKLRLDPEEWTVRAGEVAVSPDGERIAVDLSLNPTRRRIITAGPSSARMVVAVMNPDGASSRLVLNEEGDRHRRWVEDVKWSGDGKALFMLIRIGDNRRDQDAREVAVWRAGEPNAPLAATTLPAREGELQTATLPDGRLAVISQKRAWIVNAQGQKTRLTGQVEQALVGSSIAGLDKQGRLIVRRPEGYLAAVNLDTGQVARIYP
jgi:hypothetical protein